MHVVVVLRLLGSSGRVVNPWSRYNRRRRVQMAEHSGLRDLGEGNWPQALRHLRRAAEMGERPLMEIAARLKAGEPIAALRDIRGTGHMRNPGDWEGLEKSRYVRDGKTLTTDGPFAETREQLGGYYLVEAKDLDAALAIAARIPGARFGSIEVRPIWVYNN